MKRRVLPLILAVLLLAQGTAYALAPVRTYEDQFADVPSGAWYYDNVRCLYELGLTNGHGREDRQRQAQCHHGQQGNDLFPGHLLHLPHLFLVHFAVFRPEFWGGIRAYHNSILPQGFCQGQEARAAGLRGSAGLTVFGVDAGQGLWYNISKMRIAYGERAFMEMIGTKWA